MFGSWLSCSVRGGGATPRLSRSAFPSCLSLGELPGNLLFQAIFDNSFRSYLILRPKDKSDPDPKLTTVLLHIWPLMLLVTLANVVLLVLIAGLTGAYIFPALVLCFILNYGILRYFCRFEVGGKPEPDPESVGTEPNEDQRKRIADEEETQFFIVMAAFSSTWLPSVVGHQKMRIFLVSGITSLVSKVLLLTVAVALARSGLQTKVYKRPFLLFCFNENSTRLNEMDVVQCKMSDGNCLENYNLALEKRLLKTLTQLEEDWLTKYNKTSTFLGHIKHHKEEIDKELKGLGIGKVQQKIRICGSESTENSFQVKILAGLVVVVALAAYCTYRLHKIADYQVKRYLLRHGILLFFSTGTLHLIQTSAVLHPRQQVQGDTSLVAVRSSRRSEAAFIDRSIRYTKSSRRDRSGHRGFQRLRTRE